MTENRSYLSSPDHCVFTGVDVEHSIILNLLLRDQVFIEDNFFFVDGPFHKFLWSNSSNVVLSSLRHGLIIPLVKYDADSFSELVEKMEAKMGASMNISDNRRREAEHLDNLLKRRMVKTEFRRLSDKGISLYDQVLTSLFTGDPPVLNESGLQEQRVNALWRRTSSIREDWLARSLQSKADRGNLSCAKSDFVRYAAVALEVDEPRSLQDLKERAPLSERSSDLIQVAKWAHDANYISRGEAVGCGTSVFMPNDMEAAMILKSQTSVSIPGLESASTTVEVVFPTIDQLLKADWQQLLACRLTKGESFFDSLAKWSTRAPLSSGKEREELDNQLRSDFQKYSKALCDVCDASLAETLEKNFTSRFTVGQGSGLLPQISSAVGGFLVQHLVPVLDQGKLGVAARISYGIHRYLRSRVVKRNTNLGADSGVVLSQK